MNLQLNQIIQSYLMSISIHDAYGGFGERNMVKPQNVSQQEIRNQYPSNPGEEEVKLKDNGKYPNDASFSNYPVKIRCPKCQSVDVTRMNSEMGAAAWLWCVLLSPFACLGISCLCLESCRDKIHFCTRCGGVVGKKYAKVC